jgi:membrane-associated phospholipid phosphatase
LNRKIGAICFVWSIVVISAPRVYLGLHYPTDIVAGAFVEIVISSVALLLCRDRYVDIFLKWEKTEQEYSIFSRF